MSAELHDFRGKITTRTHCALDYRGGRELFVKDLGSQHGVQIDGVPVAEEARIRHDLSLREVATAKGDVPARKGYPGYLYSDLAEIYERSGRIKQRHGSITLVPILSMPADDITHPIPDLTGYITEGQIVLDRALHNAGVYPPVNVSPSLSRLMKDGIGKDDTRDDHPRVAQQLFALYARAQEVRNLASIIGAEELSGRDRNYLDFAEQFDRRFVQQGEDEDRSIVETLNLAWELLSMFPYEALSRVSEADLAKYHHRAGDAA